MIIRKLNHPEKKTLKCGHYSNYHHGIMIVVIIMVDDDDDDDDDGQGSSRGASAQYVLWIPGQWWR